MQKLLVDLVVFGNCLIPITMDNGSPEMQGSNQTHTEKSGW